MISSQNNVRKYRTKGHEQVYIFLSPISDNTHCTLKKFQNVQTELVGQLVTAQAGLAFAVYLTVLSAVVQFLKTSPISGKIFKIPPYRIKIVKHFYGYQK